MKNKLISAQEALILLLEGNSIAEEGKEYFYHFDGTYICVYHYTDKRYFISTKHPKEGFTLYDGIQYYIL